MNLEEQVAEQIKAAMREKDSVRLAALRAIKSELLLFKTAKANAQPSPDDELRILNKMAKQRDEAAATYQQNGRPELAANELAERQIIAAFLPQQLGPDELAQQVAAIVAQAGASSPKDMGKVMGLANKALAGKASGKDIAEAVKAALAPR